MSDVDTRELYPFQVEGIRFLTARKGQHPTKPMAGGFLWDDPGLGKTIQAIHAANKAADPTGVILIVCPNSLKGHWREEIRRALPGDKNRILTASKAGRVAPDPQNRKPVPLKPEMLVKHNIRWVIVHYTGLRISAEDYKQVGWAVIVADECHYVKNKNAARTKALLAVSPKRGVRIGLTATPYSRDPSDLWSQLFWMAPHVGGLQNYWRFYNLFTDYTWEERRANGRVVGKYRKVIGGKNLDTLAQVLAAYGVCRRKEHVAKQLPPITETKMPLELEPGSRQERVYDALKDRDRAELAILHTSPGGATGDGGGANAPAVKVTAMVIKNVLSRMIKMERWLSHPASMDPGVSGAKMDWLREWADSFPYPAVIVTRFKSSAKYVAGELGVSPITGDIPVSMRDVIVEKWKSDSPDAPQWLVGTIHTLGTGLNLEKAHAMVCYDQVYDPILMEQVRHRTHRITSEHPVEVIYLVIEGTSNEVVYESFKRKWRDLETVKAYLQVILGLSVEGEDT